MEDFLSHDGVFLNDPPRDKGCLVWRNEFRMDFFQPIGQNLSNDFVADI